MIGQSSGWKKRRVPLIAYEIKDDSVIEFGDYRMHNVKVMIPINIIGIHRSKSISVLTVKGLIE